MPDDVLYTVTSVFGNTIRITATQWAHITEAHDYMSGNMDKILETLAEPERVIGVNMANRWRCVPMPAPISPVKPLL